MNPSVVPRFIWLGAFILCARLPALAQSAGVQSAARWSVHLAGEGTVGVTTVNGRPGGGTITEGFVTRPVISAHVSSPRAVLTTQIELNLEGVTLPRGELNPGIYGEGYYDRRHPHTLFHDAVVTLQTPSVGLTRVRTSLAVGRGFAPFGTDDPMSRPFLKFPANHHLAQLLERIIAVGAVSIPVGESATAAFEASTFNGDDPIGPFIAPQWSRFGDSWSGRATFVAQPQSISIEGQVSYADVRSPDVAAGGGLDHRKSSASLRIQTARRWRPYVLVEFATTSAFVGESKAYDYSTWLVEGALHVRSTDVGMRVERADRVEDERFLDPFRSPRPPHDFLNLGVTRWTSLTGHLGQSFERGVLAERVTVAPFIEATVATPRPLIRGSVFDPLIFYGRRHVWAVSLGTRVGLGSSTHGRMGRYGAGAIPSASTALNAHREHM